MGHFIQWHYNNESLTGFHINDEIGASKVAEKANYIYTTMLLSSEPLTTHNRTMASIILVSFMGPVPSSFNITCSSGSLCQTVRAGPVSNVSRSQASTPGNSNSNMDLVLDYILSYRVVGNISTHIFICRANHSSLSIQSNGPLFNFTSSDVVGSRKVVLSSEYTVKELAMCIDRTILTITSIFIVTGNSDVQVTCSYEGNERRVHSNLEYETQNTVPVEGVTDSTFVATNVQTNSTTKNNRMSTNKDDVVMNSSDTANKQTIFVTVATLILCTIIQ